MDIPILIAILGIVVLCLVTLRESGSVLKAWKNIRRKDGDKGDLETDPSTKKESFGSNSSQPHYADVFPPSRRDALAQLPQDAMKGSGMSALQLSELPPNYEKLTPDKSVSDTDEMLDRTTPTGFTVEEIRRLGDFPDYATLSGLPLPEPHTNFDINNARHRPYRPFRWPYHQTMCKLLT
jgi:hypothetical protein